MSRHPNICSTPAVVASSSCGRAWTRWTGPSPSTEPPAGCSRNVLPPRRPTTDPGRVRILAVDWGQRRIGLAVSDPTATLATPLPTLTVRGRADAVAAVAKIAGEQEA